MTKPRGELSDVQMQERLRDIQRRRRRQREDDLRALLSEEWGRRLLYSICFEQCAVHNQSFAGAIKDGFASALHTSHREGRRAVGSELYAEAQKLSHSLCSAMMTEQFAAREADLALKTPEASAHKESDS